MTERILRTVEKHAMFSPGLRLGVAVSGGADSMFLLHMLQELAPRWDLRLRVVHIDHGLRGQASREDAEFVRAAAEGFALPFDLRRAELPAGNLEQEARRERTRYFSELYQSGALERVATGHTRSDQAETVLYRLLRGAGLAGLRGILPIAPLPDGGGVVRPLLDLNRGEIEDWLRERGVAWREDASNLDRSFARNRLRHEVLPLLRSGFNPQLDETLAHLAVLAREEEDWAEAAVPEPEVKAGAVYFEVPGLLADPPALARRRIRRALEAVKGDLRQIDFGHVETVLEMARSERGSGRAQLPGIDAYRSFGLLRIAPPNWDARYERDWSYEVAIPGAVGVPACGSVFTFERLNRSGEVHDKVEGELDWPRLACFPERPFTLRNWRPGDRYPPVGSSEPQKLKSLFQEARVPLWERRTWPVLVYGNEIVWTRRFGPSAAFTAGPGSRGVLRIRERELS